jgi:hypothetical protein
MSAAPDGTSSNEDNHMKSELETLQMEANVKTDEVIGLIVTLRLV